MKPSRYAHSAPERVVESEVQKLPEFCGVADCQTRRIKLPNGDWKHVQGYADVIITLPDGGRVARCQEHYLRQIYRTGHGKDCDISGRHWQMSLADVQAFRAELPEGSA